MFSLYIFYISVHSCDYFSHLKKKKKNSLLTPLLSLTAALFHFLNPVQSHLPFSTKSALVKFTNDLHLLSYDCEFSVLIFPDLSAACDLVDYLFSLKMFSSLVFQGTTLCWFSSSVASLLLFLLCGFLLICPTSQKWWPLELRLWSFILLSLSVVWPRSVEF